MSNLMSFDGKNLKSISPQAGLNDAYFSSLTDALQSNNLTIAGGLTPLKAQAMVPWVYRCIEKKATLVAHMPYALVRKGAANKSRYPSGVKSAQDFIYKNKRQAIKTDLGDDEVTDDPAYASIMDGFRKTLYLVESSLCLSGAAYLRKTARQANGKDIVLDWYRSIFIRPHVVPGQGLTGFDYTDVDMQGNATNIPLEEMVYFWRTNYRTATQPGAGEAQVSLGAGSILYSADAMYAGYFNNGGVPMTVFEVPASMPADERDNFQNFVNRRLNGIKNALRSVVVRVGLKPTVIGSKLKDLGSVEITSAERENVAVAFGFPPPMIEGKNENKATAEVNNLITYLDNIIPETDMLFERFNNEFFNEYGLEIVSKPEELEAIQSAQLEQAQAVSLIVGAPVITIDEGRELLGYEPMPKQEAGPDVEPTVPDELPIASLSVWRDGVLRAMKAGNSPDIAVPDDIPLAYVTKIDRQLKQCKTVAQARKVFERNWPKQPAQDGAALLAAALDRATKALQESEK